MVDKIGIGGGGLARQAIEAALERSSEASARLDGLAQSRSNALTPESSATTHFAAELDQTASGVVDQARRVDELPQALVTGQITDVHEVAAQLKQAELSFKFALEVRNKFIDAYREVMRMSV